MSEMQQNILDCIGNTSSLALRKIIPSSFVTLTKVRVWLRALHIPTDSRLL